MDCALAELYTRSVTTERILQEQKHAEVLNKLYTRMNEVSFTAQPLSSIVVWTWLVPRCLLFGRFNAAQRHLASHGPMTQLALVSHIATYCNTPYLLNDPAILPNIGALRWVMPILLC